MVVEEEPSLYVYSPAHGTHVQRDRRVLLLDEYRARLIKKHENTRPDKEDESHANMARLRAANWPRVPHLTAHHRSSIS